MFQSHLAIFFLHAHSAPYDVSFAGIELNHAARPVESDLSINTVSVYHSSVSNLPVLEGNSTSTYAIF